MTIVRATTNRHKPQLAHRAGSMFVGVLLLLYALFAPGGEHWLDANGSFCQAAEVVCCPVRSATSDAHASAAHGTTCSNLVGNEVCTDCHSVSSSIRSVKTDTAPTPPWETVRLPESFAVVFATISSLSVEHYHARPPSSGFQPPPLSVRCPRPPPAS